MRIAMTRDLVLVFVMAAVCPALSEDQHCCVNSNSIITTVAGSGMPGYSGDGGPATLATFSKSRYANRPLFWENSMSGIWVDPQDNLYISDGWNNVIRKMSPDGIISTWAGNGQPGFAGDGGPADQAKLFKPTHVTQDGAGNFYICDEGNNRIRKVDRQGIITTLAGNGKTDYLGDGGPATLASLNNPYGVAADREGNVYIADSRNHAIRKVSPFGIITTIVGDGKADSNGDGGPAISAEVNIPECIVVDPKGNIYFNDDGADETTKPSGRLRRVDRNGKITRVAGTDGGSSGDDGPARDAQIFDIHGIAFCGGNIYISDVLGNKIRMIDPWGYIHTVGGDGLKRNAGDGGPAKLASVHQPDGLAVDSQGNLFISEDPEHVIRKIAFTCQSDAQTPATGVIHPSFITPSLTPTPTITQTPTVTATRMITLTPLQPKPVYIKPTPEGQTDFVSVSPTPIVVKKKAKRVWVTPTPTVPAQPTWVTPTPVPHRHRHSVTATRTATGTLRKPKRFATPTSTATVVVIPPAYWTATPKPTAVDASPLLSMAAAITITYTDAPANVYLTFEDGPGHYELEVLNRHGKHLETIFSKKVIQQKDNWVDWDGKNDDGDTMPIGLYFAVLSKEGKALKKIVIMRVLAQ